METLNVLSDISVAGSVYVVSTRGGDIIRIVAVANDSIGGSSTQVGFWINGVQILAGFMLIPSFGTVAGNTFIFTPSGLNSIPVNGALEIRSNGGASLGGSMQFTILVDDP